MASLVDPQGFPVSSKLLHAAHKNSGDRPYWRDGIRDTEKDIPFQDWRTVVSYSRRLYANDGLVKGAIDQMAQHAVGRAWNPNYTGEDANWGKEAEQWLTEEWFGVCDVRGDQWDFKTSLFNDSVALDVDGDFLVILTETEGGFPAIQHLPAHKLGVRGRRRTTATLSPTIASSVSTPRAQTRFADSRHSRTPSTNCATHGSRSSGSKSRINSRHPSASSSTTNSARQTRTTPAPCSASKARTKRRSHPSAWKAG